MKYFESCKVLPLQKLKEMIFQKFDNILTLNKMSSKLRI